MKEHTRVTHFYHPKTRRKIMSFLSFVSLQLLRIAPTPVLAAAGIHLEFCLQCTIG